jgi:hypothetical protein
VTEEQGLEILTNRVLLRRIFEYLEIRGGSGKCMEENEF